MMSIDFSDEEFERVLEEAQRSYRTFGRVRCPYFDDTVNFSQEGFEHLRSKSWNRGRERRDQFLRLKHINRALEIVRLSRTLQGFREGHEWERRHRHGRWEKLLVPVTYSEFVAVLDRRRFKVIVKQQSNNERIFWSLIPYWKGVGDKRAIIDGDPAED